MLEWQLKSQPEVKYKDKDGNDKVCPAENDSWMLEGESVSYTHLRAHET